MSYTSEGGGGGNSLIRAIHIGKCGPMPKGCVFSAVLVINRVSVLAYFVVGYGFAL